jgi:hypothetical protein
MSGVESRRGRRRRLTRRVALRRRHAHLSLVHPEYLANPSPENVDCVCEIAPYYFAKRPPFASAGRRRRRGQPKLGRGNDYPRMSAEMRSRSNRRARDLTAGRVPFDWVEPGRGFYGALERRAPREL